MDGISGQSQRTNRDHYHSYTGVSDSRRSKKERKYSDQYLHRLDVVKSSGSRMK